MLIFIILINWNAWQMQECISCYKFGNTRSQLLVMYRNSVILSHCWRSMHPLISRLFKSDFPMWIFCVVTLSNFFHFTFFHSRLLNNKCLKAYNSTVFSWKQTSFCHITVWTHYGTKQNNLRKQQGVNRYLLKYSIMEWSVLCIILLHLWSRVSVFVSITEIIPKDCTSKMKICVIIQF